MYIYIYSIYLWRWRSSHCTFQWDMRSRMDILFDERVYHFGHDICEWNRIQKIRTHVIVVCSELIAKIHNQSGRASCTKCSTLLYWGLFVIDILRDFVRQAFFNRKRTFLNWLFDRLRCVSVRLSSECLCDAFRPQGTQLCTRLVLVHVQRVHFPNKIHSSKTFQPNIWH